MNIPRGCAPYVLFLATANASAQIPNVTVTTPDPTVDVAPGQEADIPLVFTNGANVESPEVELVITLFADTYTIEQTSDGCGAIEPSPEFTDWRQFSVAPIPAGGTRTCIVRVHRAADEYNNTFADWFVQETESWVDFSLGTFADIGIAASRVAFDGDPDGTIRTSYRIEATNHSAIDVNDVVVQVGPTCIGWPVMVDVDPADGCSFTGIYCGFTGSDGPGVLFSSVAAGQSKSCLVRYTAPPDIDTHVDVGLVGPLVDASTGGYMDDDNPDDNHLAIDLADADGSVNVNQEGLGGAWYNSATGGQGMELTFSPDDSNPGAGTFFGAWYTYDVATAAESAQRWYSLQSVLTGDAQSLDVTIYQNTGGNFNAAPSTDAVAVGTGTLAFYTCTTGLFTYSLDDGRSGTIPLQRLMPNVECVETGTPANSGSDFGLGGTWYNPATGGQGLMIEINPSDQQAFFGWYTYATEGEAAGAAGQRWFSAQAPYVVGSRTMDLTLYASNGGTFDTPGGVTTTPVGTATLTFASCTSATLDYAFAAGELEGESGSIPLTRLGATPASCQTITQ